VHRFALVADDEAFIDFDPKAHEQLVSVLPATLRSPLHADATEPDTRVPPAGAWEPRPVGVVDSDETLEAQATVWVGRTARGALSEAALRRRRAALDAHFTPRAKLASATVGAQLPTPSFFQECVKVQTPGDVPAIVARHRAMEAAARDQLAAQDIPYTLKPSTLNTASETQNPQPLCTP
jgi:hypothetical protein